MGKTILTDRLVNALSKKLSIMQMEGHELQGDRMRF
jgi:hypothetical protein